MLRNNLALAVLLPAVCSACGSESSGSDAGQTTSGPATSSTSSPSATASTSTSTTGTTTVTSGSGAATATSGATAQTGSGGSGGSGTEGGLAADYPGDQGIESDSAVIFADDFEAYSEPSELNQRWDAVYQNELVVLTTEPENVYAGSQALAFYMPVQPEEISDATDKVLSEELDVLYLRYYSKFQAPYDIVGSSHNGASISAHYFENGNATPGVPADGTNKFLVALENWRGEAETPSPGLLNVYVYHPEQRDVYGDHWFLSGLVSPNTSLPYDFGPEFVPHDDIIVELDRWYCYEFMVKANTPGVRDGEVRIWLDGEPVAVFMNLRFRDVADLKIDRFGLSFHIHDNANGDKKFYDNVVAATRYVGPMLR